MSLLLLSLLSQTPAARAVDPTFSLAGGVYFTGKNNPVSGRYLLHDPDRFPVVPVVNIRPGLLLTDHWGTELNIGWMQGNTLQYGYGFTMWYPRLEAQYHLTPDRPYDVFVAAGAGFTHTKVNRQTAEDQSNDGGFGLYRNPSIDGLVDVGAGVKLHLVGPLWARTDIRDNLTLGGDPTPDRSDIFNNFEWVVSLDLQRAPAKPVVEEPPCVDTDGDGLCEDDTCPTEPEDKDSFEDTDGCPDPDNDKDGILDNDDKCPSEPENMNGYQDLDGCPDEIPAEVQKFTGVIEGIYFEFDKDIIKPESEVTLKAALDVLQRFPELNLEVQGHTDAKGDDVYNMDLSQRRSEAVVAWFVSRGIDAKRLRAQGYGETRAIATNDTEAGRAKNRRVEFHPFSE